MTINKIVIMAFLLQVNSFVAGLWFAIDSPYRYLPAFGSALFAYLIYMEQQ